MNYKKILLLFGGLAIVMSATAHLTENLETEGQQKTLPFQAMKKNNEKVLLSELLDVWKKADETADKACENFVKVIENTVKTIVDEVVNDFCNVSQNVDEVRKRHDSARKNFRVAVKNREQKAEKLIRYVANNPQQIIVNNANSI